MLMVVFGAGASHDSIGIDALDKLRASRDADEYQPPLANQLFEVRTHFVNTAMRYPDCRPLIALLRAALGRGEANVETELERLRAEADEVTGRQRGLLAMRYYLRRVIGVCGQKWHDLSGGTTNYLALLDRILRWNKEGDEVAFVTFNYDSLLDRALEQVRGKDYTQMDDYISGPWKLFKVHGSVNWGRRQRVWNPGPSGVGGPSFVERGLISRAEELTERNALTEDFAIAEDLVDPEHFYIPAIAIPIEAKLDRDSFECPSLHLQALEERIPRVTKLLIVGWRGAEQHFLDLMRPKLRQSFPIFVIDKGGAEDLRNRLRMVGFTRQQFHPFDLGFSAAVGASPLEQFLAGRMVDLD